MLAFSNDYYGMIFRATQSVELFCAYYKYNESGKKWIEQPAIGGSGGNISLDYTALTNKPQISGIELTGNKTLDDLGIQKKGAYITKETDPTVPAWAKAETKPTYTADEVGALPKTTTTLPNPKKIKFTGAVTDEYDGSVEKTINIPTGSSYTLPQATDKILGGVKAKTKTNETVEVAIDNFLNCNGGMEYMEKQKLYQSLTGSTGINRYD